jgi:hypothetical protein
MTTRSPPLDVQAHSTCGVRLNRCYMLVSDCRNRTKGGQQCYLETALLNVLQPLLREYYVLRKDPCLDKLDELKLWSVTQIKSSVEEAKQDMCALQSLFWNDLGTVVGDPRETEESMRKQSSQSSPFLSAQDVLDYLGTQSKEEIFRYLLQLSVLRSRLEMAVLASAKYSQTDTHTIQRRRLWEYLANPQYSINLDGREATIQEITPSREETKAPHCQRRIGGTVCHHHQSPHPDTRPRQD